MSSPGLASLLLPIDAFDTSTHQVMGRRVAGSSFAQGLAASLKPGEQFSVFTGSRGSLPALQALLQPVLQPGTQVQIQADLDPALIANSGCLHLPDPGLHQWCWLRAEGASSRFSLTGVTHTLCPHRVMQGLEQLVTAPLEPWDALICTSQSALWVVQQGSCRPPVIQSPPFFFPSTAVFAVRTWPKRAEKNLQAVVLLQILS